MENLVSVSFKMMCKQLYANDLQLIVQDSQKVMDAQEALLLIEQEYPRLGPKVNPAKTKYMANRLRTLTRPHLLEGSKNEWVQS